MLKKKLRQLPAATPGKVAGDLRSTIEMFKQLRFFVAVVAAVSLSVPLAGCSQDAADEPAVEQSAAEEVEEPKEEVEDEAEQDPVKDASPSEVALWYAEAVAGDRAGLDEYDPALYSDDWIDELQEIELKAINDPPEYVLTESQESDFRDAVADTFSRTEIEVVDEDVKGDEATVTLAIKGYDKDVGHDLAMEEVLASAGEMDKGETLYQTFIKTWQLAPISTEPILVEIPLVRSDVTGAWTIETGDQSYARDQIIHALDSNEEVVQTLQERR